MPPRVQLYQGRPTNGAKALVLVTHPGSFFRHERKYGSLRYFVLFCRLTSLNFGLEIPTWGAKVPIPSRTERVAIIGKCTGYSPGHSDLANIYIHVAEVQYVFRLPPFVRSTTEVTSSRCGRTSCETVYHRCDRPEYFPGHH